MLSADRQREDHNDLHRWHNNGFYFNKQRGWKKRKAFQEKAFRRKAFQDKAFQHQRNEIGSKCDDPGLRFEELNSKS